MRSSIFAMGGRSSRDIDTTDAELATEAKLLIIGQESTQPTQRKAKSNWSFAVMALVAVMLCAGIGVLTAGTTSPRPAARGTAPTSLDLEKAPAPCVGEGANCAESRCCQDGGTEGLQCYQKDQFYAVCNATCVKGVHPGEKHGTYDAQGQFHLDEWSCEELGERSRSACWSFGSADCPESRCAWSQGKCRERCQDMPTADSCPDTHCIWNATDPKCVEDPCSAPGEDCSGTRCCSAQRSAGGTTCFKKNDNYATCMEACDPELNEGWSCAKLGERTPIPAGCSWAGKDCSETKCCNNVGFTCAVKDDNWSACFQTVKKTTWAAVHIPIPSDWDGKILGGGRSEYAISPDPAGKVAGTSLYCFMAILPNSTEVQLMEVAKKHHQGIFACNASNVFNSWNSKKAGWDTAESTLVNTEVFINVWDQVRKDGRYINYDWTVKVDADAAFLPDRLRAHIWALRPPPGAPVYLKNTNMDKGLSNGQFLGAIEIFSKKAVETYFDNALGCKETLGLECGEDGFFKGCMDALGVGFMHDGNIMKPDFAASACQNGQMVAFHPLKDPLVLDNCYGIATGKAPDWSHNTARAAFTSR